MKTILTLLIASSLLLGSCADPVVQGDMKVTYRISGSDYNVLIKYPGGARELVYNQTKVLKRYSHASVGDPLYVLAYGCDDIVVTIVVDGKVDTVRKASNSGTNVVLIDTHVDEQ